MSPLDGALTLLAVALALVVGFRCLRVLRGMHHQPEGCAYWRFLGFGLSYVVLVCSSIGAAIVIGQGQFNLSNLGFLVSSAGLILFDRRKRKTVGTA
jgi:hypothetical protein